MAFEEMSTPFPTNRKVYATFAPNSSPAGFTSHHYKSASLLKDTPPSIIKALVQLAPVVRVLNTVLALITWTAEDDWVSFIMVGCWWLSCLYGEFVVRFAGNWAILAVLVYGYYKRRMGVRRGVVPGNGKLEKVENTQEVIDATLYEIDCLRARCSLLASPLEPIVAVFTWKYPNQSSRIGLRLILLTPLYIAALWIMTPRRLILVAGTILLTYTSSWFRVIYTVGWRSKHVRKLASYLSGLDYLPGEVDIIHALQRAPVNIQLDGLQKELSDENTICKDLRVGSNETKITTTISVFENQRRWLGLGWTSSLLPHERSPWTDIDRNPCSQPSEYTLPPPKVETEASVKRTIIWKWIDPEWRVEKERGRDADGWLYFDNAWRHAAVTEEYGKYTRYRRWIRNAECIETISPSPSARPLTPAKGNRIVLARSNVPVTGLGPDVGLDSGGPMTARSSTGSVVSPVNVAGGITTGTSPGKSASTLAFRHRHSKAASISPPSAYEKERQRANEKENVRRQTPRHEQNTEKEGNKVRNIALSEKGVVEWKTVEGGGKEMVISPGKASSFPRKPFLRRMSSWASQYSVD